MVSLHERGSQAVVHVCQARVSPEVSYQGCSLVVDPVDRYCLFESQGLSELMGYQQVEHTGQRGYALPVQLAQIC